MAPKLDIGLPVFTETVFHVVSPLLDQTLPFPLPVIELVAQ